MIKTQDQSSEDFTFVYKENGTIIKTNDSGFIFLLSVYLEGKYGCNEEEDDEEEDDEEDY